MTLITRKLKLFGNEKYIYVQKKKIQYLNQKEKLSACFAVQEDEGSFTDDIVTAFTVQVCSSRSGKKSETN